MLSISVFGRRKSKNSNHMEPGPSIKSRQKNDKTKISNIKSNVGDVFQPLWIRRYSDNADELNWFLLQSQFSFVLPCGILFWIIFLLFG